MDPLKTTVAHLPHVPGIYMYKDSGGAVIYVGKAKDLKKRVSQYFKKDDELGVKTAQLVSNIASVDIIETVSEFDALLLEAKLIHDWKPKYNIVLKDDKSPLYILLTISEPLPHVLTLRKSDIPASAAGKDLLFGPFQSASITRSILRQIRRIIPYCTQKQRTGKPCFYTHLGLCNPCPSYIEKLPDGEQKKQLTHRYRINIFHLKSILSGKSGEVMKDLELAMRGYAGKNEFEQAELMKTHIENLKYILAKRYDPMVYVSSVSAAHDIQGEEIDRLKSALTPYYPSMSRPVRIECIDISNTQGSYSTGSLVVLTDGRKDTGQYRRFRIRTKEAPNDFAMIAEVVTRRFRHAEWPMPDLLVIDGGKGQVKAAQEAMNTLSDHASIPLIGLAKRFEEIIVPVGLNEWKTIVLPLTDPAVHILERIRDEAHRFAITYHRKLRASHFV